MAGGFRDFLRKSLGWLDSVTLLSAQKTLGGTPSIALTIGGHDLSVYVIAYHYEEISQDQGYLSIWLDNRDDTFDDLSTDWPNLVRGAAVTLERGLVVSGTAYTEKLPRTWVESLQYGQDGRLLLTCIDMWGQLEAFRYASATTFSSSLHSAIASSILGQVGLTLDAGSFGFSTDFEVSIYDDGDDALIDLMDQCHEALYAGLDGAVKWKELDPTEAASYTYDFGDGTTGNHPLLPETEIAENSPRYNKITVLGGEDLQYSGTAEDATESALVGTRLRTIEEKNLSSNAEAAEYALAELRQEQADATAATLVARPHFTLRMYDVLTVSQAPPWGGPTTTGRVIEIVEDYDSEDGTWEQEIVLGDLLYFALLSLEDRKGGGGGRSGGSNGSSGSSGSKRKTRRRRRRFRRWRMLHRRKRRSGDGVDHGILAGLTPDDDHPHYTLKATLTAKGSMYGASAASTPAELAVGTDGQTLLADSAQSTGLAWGVAGGIVPVGGIIMWSGSVASIPANWALCDGTAGTPDLRGQFVIGADADSGGSWDVGDSAGDTTKDIRHNHDDGTLATDSDGHDHAVGTLTTGQGGSGNSKGTDPSILVSRNTHTHTISGSTASDSHSHDVTGSTANAGSTTQDIMPPYYALAFIMRTA